MSFVHKFSIFQTFAYQGTLSPNFMSLTSTQMTLRRRVEFFSSSIWQYQKGPAWVSVTRFKTQTNFREIALETVGVTFNSWFSVWIKSSRKIAILKNLEPVTMLMIKCHSFRIVCPKNFLMQIIKKNIWPNFIEIVKWEMFYS